MSNYGGTFSGKVGGFKSIVVEANSIATLAPSDAVDVDNDAWTFDITGRYDTNAGDAMLTWNGGTFDGDSVKLVVADEEPSWIARSWNIVDGLSAAAASYEVQCGSKSYDLALGDTIADGNYAGWGFSFEDSTLKFQKLA